MAPTPGPFACIPERSEGTPGSCSHHLSSEDLPGEGRLPKDASLDLHPPLRFHKMRGGIVTSGEGGKVEGYKP